MTATANPDRANPDRDALQHWMMAYLATICGLAADRMEPGRPLSGYDLDSVDAVEMALEMEKAFGIALDPEIFLEGRNSVSAIADALAGQPAEVRLPHG